MALRTCSDPIELFKERILGNLRLKKECTGVVLAFL